MLSKKDFLKIKNYTCDSEGGSGLLPYIYDSFIKDFTASPFSVIDGLETDAQDLTEGSGCDFISIDLADNSLDLVNDLKGLLVKAAADIDTKQDGCWALPLQDQFKKDPYGVYKYLLKGARRFKNEPTVSKWFSDLAATYKTLLSLKLTMAAGLAGVC